MAGGIQMPIVTRKSILPLYKQPNTEAEQRNRTSCNLLAPIFTAVTVKATILTRNRSIRPVQNGRSAKGARRIYVQNGSYTP
jgi:hypothetical protein